MGFECDLCSRHIEGPAGARNEKVYRLEFKFSHPHGDDEREIKRFGVCESCAIGAERAITKALSAPSMFACATVHDHEWGREG